MNMNAPGVSLFQGAESIQIDTSLLREQEEEAVKDENRRKGELGLVLETAFDDLHVNDTTVESTTNGQLGLDDDHSAALHQQHREDNNFGHFMGNVANINYAVAHQPVDHSDCEKEIHKLQMILASDRHDLQNIREFMEQESKKRNELEKKLAITEAELDRALCSKKNNHELLVEAKEKISNLENTIKKISHERDELETEKSDLLGKLETAQMLLSDVQCKYDMVERDLNRHQERNFEVKRRQMEERHKEQTTKLQQQIDQLDDKLRKTSAELESMTSRFHALQQAHQTMQCEKANTISDLSQALNKSQKRCAELLSKPDCFQENIGLQKQVARLQNQIQDMEQTITTLKQNLELTTANLDSMYSVLHQDNQEDTLSKLSQTQALLVGSTPLNPLDRVNNLKDELYRALGNIKSKRDEIRKMQHSLDDKQAEIKQLKQEENQSLVQISTLREENIKLQNKLRVLEEEFEQAKNGPDAKTQQDDNLVHNLKEQLEDVKQQMLLEKQKANGLEQHKVQQEAERKRLDALLKNLEIDLEELKQEHESLKVNYEQILKENIAIKQQTQTADSVRLELEKLKFLFKDSQAECDRLKNLYVEISNAKEALSYEFEKLLNTDKEKELQTEKEKVANLQRALKLAEVKCSELSKMLETDKLCHEREQAELRDKLEKLRLETTKANKDASNECTKCLDYVAELTKFEIQNLKLTNINAISKKEIDELTRELKNSREYITELNEQIKLSKQQEHLIKELKTKATQFEEYVKTHGSASETSTNSLKSSPQLSNKSVSTSPELERNEIKKIESRVRAEMAKLFATELKRFQTRLQETVEQSHRFQHEYQYAKSELQQRETEVELLKQAILAEREKMAEILRQKDEQHQETVQKQNITVQKTRDELKMKEQKIKELTNELHERQAQIEAERRSMKAVMKQWEEQRKSIDDVEMDWKQKFTDLQNAHESALQSWQTKYNSAKRTAANYKRYSEDKEAHMLKEYDRLKVEYDAQLAKIQLRMKESLELKKVELKQALDGGLNNNKENTATN